MSKHKHLKYLFDSFHLEPFGCRVYILDKVLICFQSAVKQSDDCLDKVDRGVQIRN